MVNFFGMSAKVRNFAVWNKTFVMRKTFSVYAIAYCVLLLVSVGLMLAYPKLELHLLLNTYHTEFLDSFFKHYSKLAEWPLYVLALLPLLWKKVRITLFYALCELSGGVIIHVSKELFWSHRPISVFEQAGNTMLPLVEGVKMHHGSSFPSGHAFTFFTFFTCCALLLAYYRFGNERDDAQRSLTQVRAAKPSAPCTALRSTCTMLLLFALATLGAYSRIYLSQHFLSDVFVGSFVGFVVPCLMFCFAGKKILKLNNEK